MDADERVTELEPRRGGALRLLAEEAIGRKIDELVVRDESRHEEGREVTAEALGEGRAQRITPARGARTERWSTSS